MRVCLFWNETAGEGISLDELKSDIISAGHTIASIVERDEGLQPCATSGVDLVAAAGGDGTIARAGRTLAGGNTPLAILPLGTANNIANSLGIQGERADLIGRWSSARVVRMDVGRAPIGGRERVVIESVGYGLVADAIAGAQGTLQKGDPESHLAEARQLYLDVLAGLTPAHCEMRLDGERISGEFVLVEVLNMPSIGPGLTLTADVNAADGRVSVVAITEDDRAALVRYLQALRDGASAPAPFKSWFANRVEIESTARMHVDDQVEEFTAIDLSIDPASLPVLA